VKIEESNGSSMSRRKAYAIRQTVSIIRPDSVGNFNGRTVWVEGITHCQQFKQFAGKPLNGDNDTSNIGAFALSTTEMMISRK
jgi:hypothetical protein